MARTAQTVAGDETVEHIIDRIIADEGSAYTENPDDNFIPTKWGVTLDALREARGKPALGKDAVRKLTEYEARNIYRERYVILPGFNRIADPELRANVVDTGVNMGRSWAARRLQEVINMASPGLADEHITIDGKVGPKTIAALDRTVAEATNLRFIARRQLRYAKLVDGDARKRGLYAGFVTFIVGWTRRAADYLYIQADEIERMGAAK